MAAEAYSEAVKSGLDHIQAAEIANETLFKGLHFSPYNVIVEILWNEFFDRSFSQWSPSKSERIEPECLAVFSNYNLNDDFAETTEYQSLYAELVGTILILLENELQ